MLGVQDLTEEGERAVEEDLGRRQMKENAERERSKSEPRSPDSNDTNAPAPRTTSTVMAPIATSATVTAGR